MSAPRKSRTSVWIALFAILVIAISPRPSVALTFDLSDPGDFPAGTHSVPGPAGVTKDGLTLTLTGVTRVLNASVNLTTFRTDRSPVGPGSVFIGALGAGVRLPNGSTSEGISGLGSAGDEALIMTFSSAVSVFETKLLLNEYDPLFDEIYVYIDSRAAPKLTSALIEPNLSCVAFACTLDLSHPNFAAALAGVGPFTELAVAASDGHFLVDSVMVIPEPEIYAMMMAGLGLMGFVARRRRQQLAAG
jgi:hypothetical protein